MLEQNIEQPTRTQLIDKINNLIGAEEDNKILEWAKLCSFTDFDSIATSLSYGLHWNKDMENCEVSFLKMVIFNIEGFPFASRVKTRKKRV